MGELWLPTRQAAAAKLPAEEAETETSVSRHTTECPRSPTPTTRAGVSHYEAQVNGVITIIVLDSGYEVKVVSASSTLTKV